MVSTSTSESVAAVEVAVTDLMRTLSRPWFARRLMAEAGVSIDVGASWALARLGRMGPCRLSELANSLGVDASTITHRVRTLERSGYVDRVVDPADGRASIIGLSADGQAALNRLRAARQALFGGLVATWTDGERTSFTSLAERLTAALTRELANA